MNADPTLRSVLSGGGYDAAPRVAIIHYWLVSMRGGERVLERILKMFPQADIYTHVYDPDAVSDVIRSANVQTTFISRLPGAKSHYQKYLPLMPRALEALNLQGYDLVISSESGPAKGVITSPNTLHVCYCHSPMRYIWDHYHDYRTEAGFLQRLFMTLFGPALRQWDATSSSRVDGVIANSEFVRRRIGKTWGREARVVYPPVDIDEFTPAAKEDVSDRFLWVSQMTPYKRADLALEAFNALGLPALMVGDGEHFERIQKMAGPNVEVRRRLPFAELKHAYATCRALVFTPEEDFGLVPVEVNASGRPVIAYGRGGARESILDGETGLLFRQQTTASLIDALQRFEEWEPSFRPEAAVANASRFSADRFDRELRDAIEAYWSLAGERASGFNITKGTSCG